MKTVGLSMLVAASLAVASSAAMAQEKVDQARIEAGTKPQGIPKAQPRLMTLEIAKQLVAAAKKSSCSPPKGSCSGAFAVTDDAGMLIYLEVIDGTLQNGPELAIRKAKTSALWRRPTVVFQEAVNAKTNTSYADGTFNDMTTSPGGVPVVKNDYLVGGVGIAAVGLATEQIDKAIQDEAEKIFGKQWRW